MRDEKRRLRRFGLTVGGALLVLGAVRAYFHYGRVSMALLAAGGALVVLGVVFPRVLGPVENAWMGLATILAWINTRIILTVLFYLVFTPVGVVMRLVRDPLNRKLHDGSASYWIRRDRKLPDRTAYERQF